ncbi:MAG: MoxR family ATPase [Acidimicrobiia bacterium]|nr:MoxR family ATPase [Acidimicrobiia bacterium]MCY4457180.1 MoxR family ATPase [Acidimicrobiaceae bacterium]
MQNFDYEETPSAFQQVFDDITTNIATVVRGKNEVIHLLVLALVCDGHVLIEDVPGIGKTSLGKALARSVAGKFGRVQFTPDLLPTDVTGMSVWNRANETFEFRCGPIFSDVLLADEINRASPKTQSALLEAMAERQVTSDGVTHELKSPFMVIATQNPIEHEGTYALPEAQLDRFLMQVDIGYPSQAAEMQILESATGINNAVDELPAVVSAETVTEMSKSLDKIYVAAPLRQYLLDLANASRNHPSLSLGLSPRGLLALQRVARAQAAAIGRQYVTPDDVKQLASVVLPHRLLLNNQMRMNGLRTRDVVTEILDSVAIPRPQHR